MRSEELLALPGITKTKFNYKFFQDFLFFLAVVALPSSFFALLPTSLFVDLRFLFLLVSIVYLVIYFKYIAELIDIPGGKALLFLSFFLIFEILIKSLFIENIPLYEIMAIFRSNFSYPLATLGFVLYIISMDNYRIYRFMYWLLWASFIQGALYVFSNITGINVFANNASAYTFNGELILQNMFAIPHYNGILFAFAFIATVTIKGFNKHWLWFSPLIVTIISIVRSQMIVYVLVIMGIIILINISKIKVDFFKFIKLLLLIFVFLGLILAIFPSHLDRIANKFRFDRQEEVSQSTYLEEGTFAFRLDLITEAYERTEAKNNLFLGNGYIREAEKGEYDFVVGQDTFIAPVIFTEGFMGLVLRLLPITLLFAYFFRLFFFGNPKYKLFAIVSIALILPEIINGVQTKYFSYYTREVFVLFVLAIVVFKDQKMSRRVQNI